MPKNLRPYKMAFTHSSQASTASKRLACNERLEYLGDAVLGAVTADYLYSEFSREREGFLSKSRSTIVCRESLNRLALKIGLDKLLGASNVGKQHNSYVYGNALEALVGAIYIDRGYEYCRRFLVSRVFPLLGDIKTVVKTDDNYKSRLIEWGQKKHKGVLFELVSEEKRNDGAFFVSRVLVDGEECGRGEGFSKRESQQNAAKEALSAVANVGTERVA